MNNYCDYIDFLKDIDANVCSAVQGYEQVGYIFNRKDIDFASVKKGWKNESGTVEIPNTVITNLEMVAGKKGYKINQLKRAFADTTVSLATGDYRNGFTQQVSFNIYDHSPEVAKLVNALANGEYVIILEQKDKGEDGINSYRVFGYENGLTATAIDQDNYSDTLANGWSIQMQEQNTSGSEYFLFSNGGQDNVEPTLALTKTAIEGMVG